MNKRVTYKTLIGVGGGQHGQIVRGLAGQPRRDPILPRYYSDELWSYIL